MFTFGYTFMKLFRLCSKMPQIFFCFFFLDFFSYKQLWMNCLILRTIFYDFLGFLTPCAIFWSNYSLCLSFWFAVSFSTLLNLLLSSILSQELHSSLFDLALCKEYICKAKCMLHYRVSVKIHSLLLMLLLLLLVIYLVLI